MRSVLVLLATTTVAIAAPPLSLDAEQIGADLSLAIGIDKGFEGDTVSLSPDLWIGVGHGVTVGIAHSDASVDRIGAGSSICVRREIDETNPRPCDRAYHGGAIDVRWATRAGPLEIAPRARLMLRGIDPYKPAFAAGAIVRWIHGRVEVWSDPYLRIGLANTDLGNRSALVIPIYAGVSPTTRVLLGLHTGYGTDLVIARDGYHVPIALLARIAITPKVDITVEGGLSTVGPQNTSGFGAAIFTLSFRS